MKFNIGAYADIKDGVIQASREGINWMLSGSTKPQHLNICVDNQTALRALCGGQCSVKEDLRACLEEIMALQQQGSSVKGQCTPLHMNIYKNDQSDTVANLGNKEPPYQHTKYIITRLRTRSRDFLKEQWIEGTPLSPNPSPVQREPSTRKAPEIPSNLDPKTSLPDHRL